MCCNLVLPEDISARDAIYEQIEELNFSGTDLPDELPVPQHRIDNPGFDGWKNQVGWALDAFSRDVLQKVVLARRVDFSFDSAPEPVELLRVLQDATPSCFHFLFESGGSAFVGATPERLFFRRGREVFSEAVAGTRPRGDTSDSDEAYRTSLLASEKDQREHDYVRQSIREILQTYCNTVTVDEVASEMKLAAGRHLVSRLSGTLREDVSDVDLLKGLHPTPAVGGAPRHLALEAINPLEDFDRGWYAGPIGWIGRDSAEFAVALRLWRVERGHAFTFFRGRSRERIGSWRRMVGDRTENHRLHTDPRTLLSEAPNRNAFHAGLLIEELVRNGITMFHAAPGSRSMPLIAAAAAHSKGNLDNAH